MTMRWVFGAGAAVAMALAAGGAAVAQTDGHAPPSALRTALAPSAQEMADQKLLVAAMKDTQRQQFAGLAKHVPALSEALDRSAGASALDPRLYLTMGLMVGSYYVEMHQNEKALAALDKGLIHHPTDPTTLGEKGVALQGMRRFEEALAAYDAGIAGEEGGPNDQARLHRGRGVVLIDLKRIDEAEAALKKSLELQPGHPIALNELKYITEIRAGGRDDRPLNAPVTVDEALELPVK